MNSFILNDVKKAFNEESFKPANRVAAIVKEMRTSGHVFFGKASFTNEEMAEIDTIYKSLKNEKNIDLYLRFFEIIKATEIQIHTLHTPCGL